MARGLAAARRASRDGVASGERLFLDSRDANLYLVANVLASLGLGVIVFYLNFLYRALGHSDLAVGALVGAEAAGVVVGALPAHRFARAHSRRASLLVGGIVTGLGLVGTLVSSDFVPLAISAAVLGGGGILAYASGTALLADATGAAARPARFGLQLALTTIAALVAGIVAGAIASPVASLLGAPPDSVLVLRVLIAAGALVAGSSVIPALFVRAVPVPLPPAEAPPRGRLLLRFLLVNACFGFGAGSFLPFLNLFFHDRFAAPFESLGLILGALSAVGSLGAFLHARTLVPRLGVLRAVVLAQLLSVVFALGAGLAGRLEIAVALLALRSMLMFGATPSFSAFTLSSFPASERAGVQIASAIAFAGADGAGSLISGAVRAGLGDAGWTINLATLGIAYVVAATLTFVLFRQHVPAGDAGVLVPAVPDSRA